jgi:hypothetical protein
VPTNLKRYTVTVTAELEKMLVADAEANDRHVATQLTWIAKQYYLNKQREFEVFKPARLIGLDRRGETVFPEPPPEQALADE